MIQRFAFLVATWILFVAPVYAEHWQPEQRKAFSALLAPICQSGQEIKSPTAGWLLLHMSGVYRDFPKVKSFDHLDRDLFIMRVGYGIETSINADQGGLTTASLARLRFLMRHCNGGLPEPTEAAAAAAVAVTTGLADAIADFRLTDLVPGLLAEYPDQLLIEKAIRAADEFATRARPEDVDTQDAIRETLARFFEKTGDTAAAKTIRKSTRRR